MSVILNIDKRNAVLKSMIECIKKEESALLEANKKDLEAYSGDDIAMYDRLKVDDDKIIGMIKSLKELTLLNDPLNLERFQFEHENGLQISNRRIAFKSGNRILLKGGKESLNSNLILVDLWHKALRDNQVDSDWVSYLQYDRSETQAFLENPIHKVDLIVPRGGEKLIAFVKQHATCPVIVSGRGNNFVYIDTEADLQMAVDIIINAKTTKISACNALDKVLIAADLPRKQQFVQNLLLELQKSKVEILTDEAFSALEGTTPIKDESVWIEEFLDYKIVLGQVASLKEAISKINTFGGGHSAAIITANEETAATFMNSVDSAAVYHNAS
uniref:aldehyde dehydrogenase family protein n=1 Tax=uncultured Eudoraea sp. TaxID=1035614 RepID=UPI002619EA55